MGRRTLQQLGLCLALSSSLLTTSTAKELPGAAEDLLIVDCVLPGQLRQLGRRTTYLSARRAVRTTALNCRVRGGEYVLRDQASLGAALSVWQQQAEGGDAAAQVTLGEILESGISGPADPAAARRWYERAAEQGSTRAMIALGNLLERGLGGSTDTAAAMTWYRRAAGLDANVALEPSGDINPIDAKLQQEFHTLQVQAQALLERQQALETLNASLASALSEQRLEQHSQAQQKADAGLLKEQIEAQQQANSELQATIAALTAATEQKRFDNARLRDALATAEAAGSSTRQLLREQLRQRELESASVRTELDLSLSTLSEREQELADAMQRIKQLNDALGALQQLQDNQRSATAAAVAEASPALSEAADNSLAGPEILLIEPQLGAGTRGLVKVSVPQRFTPGSEGSAEPGQVIGKVTAPAGLLTFTANKRPVSVNAAGVFQLTLAPPLPDQLQLTAIDQLGARSDLALRLDQQQGSAAPLPAVDFGRFHALLIANSNYAQLPQLKTPAADVEQVAALLRERYDFSTEIISDVTRYELLSALNRYRERMTRRDNLLIYYAGHGELDRTNMRGHWLPVDAELTSTANWVSNTDVTDILNVMTANHVLLVVDSCYSGTLTRSSMIRLKTGMTAAEEASWLQLMAGKRARVALSSGGLAPVLDYGGGRHSVFARALIETLAANRNVLPGRSLHQAVAARVAHNAADLEFEQLPEYAPISRAGHEAGDFVLLPRGPG